MTGGTGQRGNRLMRILHRLETGGHAVMTREAQIPGLFPQEPVMFARVGGMARSAISFGKRRVRHLIYHLAQTCMAGETKLAATDRNF